MTSPTWATPIEQFVEGLRALNAACDAIGINHPNAIRMRTYHQANVVAALAQVQYPTETVQEQPTDPVKILGVEVVGSWKA